MEEYKAITGNYNGKIHLEYLPCINYAMIHNHISSCNFCELVNEDDFDWNVVKVSIDGEFIKHSETVIEIIPGGKSLLIKTLAVEPEVPKLIDLTEGIDTAFTLVVTVSEKLAFQEDYPVTLMTYEQWTGIHIIP